MKVLWVLMLTLLVYQAPAPTYVTRPGFACRTPELWTQYAAAIDKSDARTIRNIRLSQRCIDQRVGEVVVLSRSPGFLLISGHAGRQLYIPKAYVIE